MALANQMVTVAAGLGIQICSSPSHWNRGLNTGHTADEDVLLAGTASASDAAASRQPELEVTRRSPRAARARGPALKLQVELGAPPLQQATQAWLAPPHPQAPSIPPAFKNGIITGESGRVRIMGCQTSEPTLLSS